VVQPTQSLVEFSEFTSLVAFLNSIVPSGTQVIRGQQNRAAEPQVANFVVCWPLRMSRLSTNETAYNDNVITASISGSVMTVISTAHLAGGGLGPGMLVTDGTAGQVNGSTTVVQQLSGNLGGTGTYQVNPSPQTVSPEPMYVGVAAALVPTEWVVQADCHGPNSANVAQVLFSLFRSEYGTSTFGQQATDWNVVPLWSDEARYVPFVNAEQAWEYRWTVDLHLQLNPVIGVSQQFADELHVTTVAADTGPPPAIGP
jgi:hypothetical protein